MSTDALTQATQQFLADAAQLDAATRRTLVAKLQRYTRPGGERLMLPGKIQVPAETVQHVIAQIEAMA